MLGRLRSVPRVLWFVTAAWGALLIGASLLWPMLDGYDEPQHVDMAYVYSGSPFHFYGSGELPLTKAALGAQAAISGTPPRASLGDIPNAQRGDRPSFTDFGGRTLVPGTQPNQMVQHPPLYYWTEAVLLHVPGVTSLPWDVTVWLMRLLSVLYMLPVPVLCWATARRLVGAGSPTSRRIALAAAIFPFSVPNLIRDGSSVTNDSLLCLATSAVLYLTVRASKGDLTRRTAAWMSVALAVALLTKAFALVLVPVALAGYLIGVRHVQRDDRRDDRVPWWRSLVQPLAIAAIGCIVGGLWWVRNLATYGQLQISGLGSVWEARIFGPQDHQGRLATFLPKFANEFASRIWGGIGLPDRPELGDFIVFGWLVLASIGIVAACLARAGRGDRARMLLLAATVLLTFAVVADGSFGSFRRWSHMLQSAQGRYLYHLIVAIAVLVVVGWARVLRPSVIRHLPTFLLIAALLTELAAWVLLLRSWYKPSAQGGLHGNLAALHALDRWSPLPAPITLFFVLALPLAAAVAAIVTVGRDGTGPDAEDAAPPPSIPPQQPVDVSPVTVN